MRGGVLPGSSSSDWASQFLDASELPLCVAANRGPRCRLPREMHDRDPLPHADETPPRGAAARRIEEPRDWASRIADGFCAVVGFVLEVLLDLV